MDNKRMPRARRSFAQGIIFDGTILSDIFDITEISVKPVPSMSANTVAIPGKHGSRFASATAAERTLTMKLSLLGRKRDDFSAFELWQEVSNLLIKDEPKPLHVGNGRYINAMVLDSSEIERLGTRGIATVTWTAFDPYFYGEEHEIPLTSGYNTVIIEGRCPISPVITLSGCSGVLTVRSVSTADQVVSASSITSTVAKVVIDMEAQRCTANGSYLAVNMNSTDYFDLQPGSQSVYVSSGSGTLAYQEKYL